MPDLKRAVPYMLAKARPNRIHFCKPLCSLAKRKFFFISYPKSGRTWVRFMVDDYLVRQHGLEVAHVFKAERRLRHRFHIEWTHLFASLGRPYYELGAFDGSLLAKHPCVFLQRNFFATLASAYHQAVYRTRRLEATPKEFLRHPRYGVVHLITFYNIWIDLVEQLGPVHNLSYEAMKADLRTELRRLLEWMGLEVNSEFLNQTVAAGSLENMKKLASAPEYAGTAIAASEASEPRSAKVRQGSIQGYRQLFDSEDIEYIQRLIEDLFVGAENPDHASLVNLPGAAAN